MSLHSAITSFVDQTPSAISATALSCLTSCLQSPEVAPSLVGAHRPVCVEVLSRLVSIANDGAKNAHARLMALECLHTLSGVPDDAFRRGDLLHAVERLDESFELFLSSAEVAAAGDPRGRLVVLLLRCGGYTRLKAGDVLQQLYAGDDAGLVSALVAIGKDRALEWEAIVAAWRCLYELTTPVSYFAPPSEGQRVETNKVSAFQDKVAVFLMHLTQQTPPRQVVLGGLLDELRARWVAEGMEGTSSTRTPHALHFVHIIRYVAVLLMNLADFCEHMELVRGYQQSFLALHQSFFAECLVPFVRFAMHGWADTRDPAASESTHNPFMTSAIAALRLMRFAFYCPPHTSQATLSPALVHALNTLATESTSMETQLRGEYLGMLVLVLVVEVLCNVNAITVGGLSDTFTSLVCGITEDKSPLRPGAQFTTAQAFAYCVANETSTYCAVKNESTTMLRDKLQTEETSLISDAEAAMAIEVLEEQMSLLQALMMEIAVGQLLGDLCMLAVNDAAPTRTSAQAGGVQSPHTREHTSPKSKRKNRHPPEYVCMLTKKLMREPVVLANGHRFELDALQDVVDRVGHVDPLTGESFNDELQVDMGLQQEIARYRVALAART